MSDLARDLDDEITTTQAQDHADVTHGRHCPCTGCANEDWTQDDLAPCGMHGPSCPNVYAPHLSAGKETGE